MNNRINYPNKKTYFNHYLKQVRRFISNNIYRDEQKILLEGEYEIIFREGKPNQGEVFKPRAL